MTLRFAPVGTLGRREGKRDAANTPQRDDRANIRGDSIRGRVYSGFSIFSPTWRCSSTLRLPEGAWRLWRSSAPLPSGIQAPGSSTLSICSLPSFTAIPTSGLRYRLSPANAQIACGLSWRESSQCWRARACCRKSGTLSGRVSVVQPAQLAIEKCDSLQSRHVAPIECGSRWPALRLHPLERYPRGSRQFRAGRRSGHGVALRHLLAPALCLRATAGTLSGGRAGSHAKLFLPPSGKGFLAPCRSVAGPLSLVSADITPEFSGRRMAPFASCKAARSGHCKSGRNDSRGGLSCCRQCGIAHSRRNL